MTALLVVALVLPWLLAAALGWLLFQFLDRYGRQLVALEEIKERLETLESSGAEAESPRLPSPLPAAAPAPDFSLPDLEGSTRTLADFLGTRRLVVFYNLGCSFCREMAPRLGELPEEPRVLLISHGDADEHRRLAEEHDWRCDVVLDEDWEVTSSFGAAATPSGYLLDVEGRIASELALGAEPVLALAADRPSGSNGSDGGGGLTAESLRGKEREATSRAHAAGLAVRDITESRLERNGLEAGTPAPDFTLLDLDGAERSLAEYRGKAVLLVFSDVGCGPCDALAPDLVKLHKRRGKELQLLMVSRGGREANRLKAKENGYKFPVLVQKGWEVSKRYAMFATPIAYLIDADGVIARDVAVGHEAILDLAGNPVSKL